MKSTVTVGQLKQSIKDLPDDLPIFAYKSRTDYYYLNSVNFAPKSSISPEYLELILGEEFGW